MPSSSTIDGSTLPRSIRWRIQMGLLDVPSSSDRTLCEQNFNKIRMQRERFTKLEEKSDPLEESSDGSRAEPSARVVPEDLDDPLTAALKQREAREQEDKAAQSSRRNSRRGSPAKFRRGSSSVVDAEKQKRLVRFICVYCAHISPCGSVANTTISCLLVCRRSRGNQEGCCSLGPYSRSALPLSLELDPPRRRA